MKRFSKMASGIAVIMLGIGIILCIVGAAKQDWNEFGKAYGHTGSCEAAVGSVDELHIKIPYGYLRIGRAEGDEILFSAVNVEEDSTLMEKKGTSYYISAHGDDRKLQLFGIPIPWQFFRPIDGIEEKLDKLEKVESLDDMEYLKNTAFPVYILLLPEKIYKEIEVSLGNGMIDMEHIAADRLELVVDAGEIRTRQAAATKAELVCDIGQIDAKGDFTELTSKVDIGNIVLGLSGKKEEYSGEAFCDIGSIEYGRRNYSTGIWQDIKESGAQAGKKLTVSCDIGSIQVEFEDRD